MKNIKWKASEIRGALASNSISQEMLTDHVNNVLDSNYTTGYITKIIGKYRKNEAIERVIWDLLGDWVLASRRIAKDTRVIMPDAMACRDIAMERRING